MSGETPQTSSNLSRRAAIAGLGTAGLALAAHGGPARAQEGGDPAEHPLAGTWAAQTAGGIVPQIHGADGSLIAAFPPNYVDPGLGLTFQGPALGRWEPTGERSGRLLFFQALSDAAGTYLGTFQLAAEIEASEDGQSWVGDTPPHIIMRDAANAVTFDQVVPIDPPVTATRVGATSESVVLPVTTPTAATPAT